MDSKNKLNKRARIPGKYKWKIEDIYSSARQWEKDFKSVKQKMTELPGFKGKSGQSSRMLVDLLKTHMEIMETVEKLFIYAHMKKDEDNTNTGSQALLDRAQALMVEAGTNSSFIEPEILGIPGKTLMKMARTESSLKDYRHYLDDISRHRRFILSAEEEKILAMSGEIASAPNQIFGMINNADIKFPLVKDETGIEIELTKGRYARLLESRDRQVRKDAFNALYESYQKQRNTIASTLNYSIKKDIFFSKTRKHTSTLHASLFGDNVPTPVYDNLIEAVSNNLTAMYKYISLRKRTLKVRKLHMYDLYVPIVKDIKYEVEYEQAKDMVIDSLSLLGSEYTSIIKTGLTRRWVDVFENEGKTSGAYSWGSYDTHPYVLMNYENTINNVYTLAHEMGHALHTYFSNKTQPYVNAGYKIFVAEVASILNEILLTNYLLKKLKSKQKRLYILNHYLEQFRGTVYRQTMFAEFEKIIHHNAQNGIPLTNKSLSDIYHDLNIKYYGPEIEVDKIIDIEWARVPHFYSAFYVYKYALGFSAAASLATKILSGDSDAIKRYLEFLSSGDSDYPLDLLKKAGVDMTSPGPVNNALGVFSDLVNEMEAII